MPLTYGDRYLRTYGTPAALARIDHLRSRMQEDPHVPPGIGEESDSLGRALLARFPGYDWITNTHPAGTITDPTPLPTT